MVFKSINFILWFSISVVTCYSCEVINRKNDHMSSPEERQKNFIEYKKRIAEELKDNRELMRSYVQDDIPMDE